MTWICPFGVVNCPICQRAREGIKAMMPNIPDKSMDKIIKENKIDLHQKIEQVSIEIIANGEPKIEIKGKPLDKDGKPKIPIGIDNPNNPFFSRQLLKTGPNTEPEYCDTPGTFMDNTSSISIKEGDIPIYLPSLTLTNFEPDKCVSWGNWPAYPMEPSSFSTGYRTIGGETKKIPKDQPQRVDRLIPTSKLYKDMKDNDEPELYRKQGIKCYIADDGKKTLLVDRKSEIQF